MWNLRSKARNLCWALLQLVLKHILHNYQEMVSSGLVSLFHFCNFPPSLLLFLENALPLYPLCCFHHDSSCGQLKGTLQSFSKQPFNQPERLAADWRKPSMRLYLSSEKHHFSKIHSQNRLKADLRLLSSNVSHYHQANTFCVSVRSPPRT